MLEYKYKRPGSFLKKHEIMLLLVIRVLKSAEKLCKTYQNPQPWKTWRLGHLSKDSPSTGGELTLPHLQVAPVHRQACSQMPEESSVGDEGQRHLNCTGQGSSGSSGGPRGGGHRQHWPQLPIKTTHGLLVLLKLGF